MTPGLLAWLTAALDAAQRGAEAAAERAWSPHWEYDGLVHEIRDLNNGNTLATMYFDEIGKHVEATNPAAVLRRIAADRKMIADLLDERHVVADDPWFSCAAATEERDGGCSEADRRGKPCDCGRDERVERRLRIIAEGYGWTETT